MGAPVNAAIVDELFTGERAFPGDLASRIKRSLGISGPTVSSHLTRLEELLVVQRHRDGTVSLTDSEALALVLQGARRFSKAALTQAAKDESADHYVAERRINKRRSAFVASDAREVQRDELAANVSRSAGRERRDADEAMEGAPRAGPSEPDARPEPGESADMKEGLPPPHEEWEACISPETAEEVAHAFARHQSWYDEMPDSYWSLDVEPEEPPWPTQASRP